MKLLIFFFCHSSEKRAPVPEMRREPFYSLVFFFTLHIRLRPSIRNVSGGKQLTINRPGPAAAWNLLKYYFCMHSFYDPPFLLLMGPYQRLLFDWNANSSDSQSQMRVCVLIASHETQTSREAYNETIGGNIDSGATSFSLSDSYFR